MEQTRIIGMQELYQALSTKIPRHMEGKVLQKALTAGALIVKRRIEQNIGAGGDFPADDTGTLRRSVYTKRSKFNNSPFREDRIVAIRRGKKAGKRGLDAYYAPFVEYGHRVGTKKGGYLYKERGRSMIEMFRGAGAIPDASGGKKTFVAARPFMRPAFEASQDQALQAILDSLAEQLEVAKKGANW